MPIISSDISIQLIGSAISRSRVASHAEPGAAAPSVPGSGAVLSASCSPSVVTPPPVPRSSPETQALQRADEQLCNSIAGGALAVLPTATGIQLPVSVVVTPSPPGSLRPYVHAAAVAPPAAVASVDDGQSALSEPLLEPTSIDRLRARLADMSTKNGVDVDMLKVVRDNQVVCEACEFAVAGTVTIRHQRHLLERNQRSLAVNEFVTGLIQHCKVCVTHCENVKAWKSRNSIQPVVPRRLG